MSLEREVRDSLRKAAGAGNRTVLVVSRMEVDDAQDRLRFTDDATGGGPVSPPPLHHRVV